MSEAQKTGLSAKFSEKARKWREKALEVLEDRLALYELEIPAEMREGMDRIEHEGKGELLRDRFSAVSKGGIWGTIVALDTLSYYGTELKMKPKDDKDKGPRLG